MISRRSVCLGAVSAAVVGGAALEDVEVLVTSLHPVSAVPADCVQLFRGLSVTGVFAMKDGLLGGPLSWLVELAGPELASGTLEVKDIEVVEAFMHARATGQTVSLEVGSADLGGVVPKGEWYVEND